MITEMIRILNHEALGLVKQIQSNLSSTGTNATGNTSESIEFDINTEGQAKYRIQILGREYVMSVETGRKPTPEKKPSRDMISNIVAWLQSIGKSQGLAWAIAAYINQHGTKLWQQGGRKDIISSVISDSAMDKLAQRLLDDFGDQFATESANIFNDKK